MEKKYAKIKNSLSYIEYEYVFCTRYKRKVFDDEKVKQLFLKVLDEVAQSIDFEVIKVNVNSNYVHLRIKAHPLYSANEFLAKIKTTSSNRIRNEFEYLSHLSSLWNRKYMISISSIKQEEINEFLNSQKNRG